MQKELNQMKNLCISCPNFSKSCKSLVKSSFIIILLLILTCASFNAFGQKCNYEKNEMDALTELMVKRTQPILLTRINGQPLYAKAQSIGPNKYLKLLFYTFNDFSFQEDREVGFVLSNKEELMLYPRVMPVDSTKMDDITTVNSLLIYKLTDNQYEKLTQYPVLKFKYFLATGFVEEPIKSSNQGIVIEILRCVE